MTSNPMHRGVYLVGASIVWLQSDQSTLAHCTCLAMVDDCQAKAMETQTKVVATCPPP
jgi:hypothetical protein